MLGAGVLVGTVALVAFAWNLSRINDVMKAVSSAATWLCISLDMQVLRCASSLSLVSSAPRPRLTLSCHTVLGATYATAIAWTTACSSVGEYDAPTM